jgi:periplasmic divalent cation tolerance protein
MTRCLQVSTTTAERDDAVRIARSAVEARRAASAQVIGPVTSVFWHLGQVGEGEEWQIYFKTTTGRYPDLEAQLRREHPWDNPEITATELVLAAPAYLEWLANVVEPPGDAG